MLGSNACVICVLSTSSKHTGSAGSGGRKLAAATAAGGAGRSGRGRAGAGCLGRHGPTSFADRLDQLVDAGALERGSRHPELQPAQEVGSAPWRVGSRCHRDGVTGRVLRVICVCLKL